MNNVFKINLFAYRVKNTERVNGLLYFFRRIPLIGKNITPHIYQVRGLKTFLTIIHGIYRFIVNLFFGALVFLIAGIGTAVYLDNIIHQNKDIIIFTVTIWIIILGIVHSIPLNFLIVDDDALKLTDKFNLSKQNSLRILSFGKFLRQNLTASMLPLLILSIIQNNIWIFLAGSGFYAVTLSWFQFICRLRWRYKMAGNISIVGYLLIFAVMPLILFASGKLEILSKLIFNPIAAIVSWLITAAFVYYWLKFPLEGEFIKNMIWKLQKSTDALKMKKSGTDEYLGQGISLEKKISANNEIKVPPKATGSNYLNALLFARYQPQLKKMLRNRLLLIAAAGLIGLIGIKVLMPHNLITEKEITKVYGILFFVFYNCSFGKTIVQVLFVNCDSAMLYYPFYRQPKAIVKGFNYRFIQTIKFNSIIAALILVLFMGFPLVSPLKIPLMFYLILILELFALTLFFSFHELFIYYLIQPFTSDLRVVSPLYKIITVLMWIISYNFFEGKLSGYGYAITIGVFTLIYVAIGTIIIYWFAPKTFRIRT